MTLYRIIHNETGRVVRTTINLCEVRRGHSNWMRTMRGNDYSLDWACNKLGSKRTGKIYTTSHSVLSAINFLNSVYGNGTFVLETIEVQ